MSEIKWQPVAVGKRNNLRRRGVHHLSGGQPFAGIYTVSLAWPIGDGRTPGADDPESERCGCDFVGQDHAHLLALYESEGAASQQYAAAKRLLADGVPEPRVAAAIGLSDNTSRLAWAELAKRQMANR